MLPHRCGVGEGKARVSPHVFLVDANQPTNPQDEAHDHCHDRTLQKKASALGSWPAGELDYHKHFTRVSQKKTIGENSLLVKP